MMNKLRARLYTMPLRQRLLWLSAISFAAMTVFATRQIYHTALQVKDIQATQNDIEIAFQISELFHQLQKERGLSVAFLGVNAPVPVAHLEEIQESTDRQAQTLQTAIAASPRLSTHLREEGQTIIELSRTLEEFRSELKRGSHTQDEVLSHYTNLNSLLVHVLAELGAATAITEIRSSLTTYAHLIQLKEYAGLERAQVNLLLTDKNLPVPRMSQWQQLIGAQKAQEVVLLSSATFLPWNFAQQYRHYQLLPSSQKALSLRAELLKDKAQGTRTVELGEWIAVASQRIDGLREIEYQVQIQLNEQLARLRREAYWRMSIVAGLYLLVALLVVLMSRQVALSIIRPTMRTLALVRRAARQVRRNYLGKTGFESPPPSTSLAVRDELSEVLSRISHFIGVLERSQDELASLHQYSESIVNSLSETLLIFNRQGRLVRINQRGLTLLCRSANDLLGCTVDRLLECDAFESNCADFASISQKISSGEITDKEARLKTQDSKTQIPVVVTGSLLLNGSGTPDGLVLAVRDARESRLLKQLIATQNDLVATAKLASVGELASQIAHEINSPLSAILLGADLIRRAAEKNKLDPASLNRHLDSIVAVTERVSKITTNMRKLALGISSQEVRPFSVQAMINEAINLVEERLKSQCVVIECDLPQDEVIHLGNEVAIGHALSCLLNSVLDGLKASPEKKVQVRLKPEAGQFAIMIEGSCPNFTSAEAEGLFSVRNNLHGLEDGAGYGLVVSKDIVSRFGGEIRVDLAQAHRTFVMRFTAQAVPLRQAA